MFLHNMIHVIVPEGGAGEVRHGQPDGDQPAGVEIIHVGGLVSAALEARDFLQTSGVSPLSSLCSSPRLLQAGDDTSSLDLVITNCPPE